MGVNSNNRVLRLLNHKMRVILCDCRTFIGVLIAFDKNLNIVLKDTTEHKRYKPKKTKPEIEMHQPLGTVIIRGENITSIIVEGEPVYEASTSRSGSSSSRH